ncbi:MAG: RecQ family ATP-dependent DNA helicase [Paludibacteraceae bacterium]|nr:RecQ family ATP-dependent DNA helicase [Paludibacteraceae bacterium]
MTPYLQKLKQYWGYDEFRPSQLEIIESIGSGKDTLGLLPTGGGKSITFQVPALCQEGRCLVITPLIALMKDQVENLKKKEIKAIALHSGLTFTQYKQCLDNICYNKTNDPRANYKFIYVSPERLSTDTFLEALPYMNISMVAVDEAHCISQWGYDFRPEYKQIAEIRDILPNVPFLALTATATPEVAKDIQSSLLFKEENVKRISFYRNNLAYKVKLAENKDEELIRLLNKTPGSAIIYVRNRKKTKEISEFLNKYNISSDFFHAGLDNSIKDLKQDSWKNNKFKVMVATNAFGMGIDKPDVRIVIHIDIPDSIEAYFQEAGRAGRDRNYAECILLYNKRDLSLMKKRLTDSFPSKEFICNVYNQLGNYFQLGVNYGEGNTFDFDLQDFCNKFHLPTLPTQAAIKILDLDGYIEYKDEKELNSRVIVTKSRRLLYDTHFSEEEDAIMQFLLRKYTGIFADYTIISETEISLNTNIDQNRVYEVLSWLRKTGIIDYIPKKSSPAIRYRQDRIPPEILRISTEVYEHRLMRYKSRMESMINYVSDTNHCRSRLLLDYFGENETSNCGICDYCLNKNSSNSINDKILSLFKKEGPKRLSDIIVTLNEEPNKVIDSVRVLLDNKEIKTADNITFEIR